MYYTNLLKIKKNDKVFEVGPGASPYWRANVLADKFENNDTVPTGNFGGGEQKTRNKPFFKIENNKLPFVDKSFDWVICSHVLEHVDVTEIVQFVNELKRVAKKLYIEFPCFLYELTNHIPAHITTLTLNENKIFYIQKSKLDIFSNLSKDILMYYLKKLQKNKEYKQFYTLGNVFNADKLSLVEIHTNEEFYSLLSKNTFLPEMPSKCHKVKNFLLSKLINSKFSSEELFKIVAK